jgi:hypothetical protein
MATTGFAPLRPLRPRGQSLTDDETQQSALKPATTFAGMQQRGIARPAPRQPNSYYQGAGAAPAATPAPATYRPPVDPNRQALTDAVGQMLAQPSAYSTDQLKRDYDTLLERQGLDAARGKKAIDETMAARGLHASTLTGDAYGNLESQQALERRQFSNDYLDREASDLATARANAISAALGVQSENANEGLATFGANQAAQKQAADIALGQGNLGVSQQAADTAAKAQVASESLGNRTLDVNTQQSDLDRELQRMLGVGSLDLQNRSLESENSNRAADREQNAAQFAQSIGLDYAQLSQQDKQYMADLAERQRQFNQSDTRAGQQLDLDRQKANDAAFLGFASFAQELGLDPSTISKLVQYWTTKMDGAPATTGGA